MKLTPEQLIREIENPNSLEAQLHKTIRVYNRLVIALWICIIGNLGVMIYSLYKLFL